MITDLRGQVQDWNVLVTFLDARLDSGDTIEAAWQPIFERLQEPFEIRPGLVVAPGAYHTQFWGVELETASKRPWVVALSTNWGGIYDGTLRQTQARLTLKPGAHVGAVLSFERNSGSLPAGKFVAHIFSARLDVNASPDLAWSNLVQYDSDSRLLGVQSRVRFTLRPGSDLFVVFDRGWLRTPESRYRPSFDRGSAKLQYTVRL